MTCNVSIGVLTVEHVYYINYIVVIRAICYDQSHTQYLPNTMYNVPMTIYIVIVTNSLISYKLKSLFTERIIQLIEIN